jgi:cytochrome P450
MSMTAFELTGQEYWPRINWHPVTMVVGPGALREVVGPVLVFSRRDDVATILGSPQVFSARRTPWAEAGRIPLDTEPPDHTRYREILASAFGPAAAKKLAPQIRTFAAETFQVVQIDQLAAGSPLSQTTITFERQMYAYCAAVVLEALGLPNTDRDHVGNMKRHGASRELLTDYVRSRIPDAHGVLADLEGQLSDDERVGVATLCISAGVVSTARTAIHTAIEIAQRPQLRQQLRADPELLPRAAEEMIRCYPSAPLVPRTVMAETNVAGVTLRPGATVCAFVGGVNREHGHTPLADGKPHRHMSFGAGVHRCLGMHLARQALIALIEQLLRIENT